MTRRQTSSRARRKGGAGGSQGPEFQRRADSGASHPYSQGAPDSSSTPEIPVHLSPSRILLLAVGFGLWAGIVEIMPILILQYGRVMLRVGRDFFWMTPLADTTLFVLAGLAILAVGRFWHPATGRSVVMGIFAGITTLAAGFSPERLHPAAVLLLALGVGVQVARWTQGPIRKPKLLWASVAVALILVVLSAGRVELNDRRIHQHWVERMPAPRAEAPNIVLLILDTVRGASLDFLEDLQPQSAVAPIKTPTLEELAGRSVVFTRAIAPSPWTLPSHGSMFTGRWANRLSDAYGPGAEGSYGLDPGMTTLPEVLRDNGYMTAGFVGNLLWTFGGTGLVLGFHTYEDFEASPAQVFLSCSIGRRVAQTDWLRRVIRHHEVLNRKDARTVVNQFLKWQNANQNRPFFAFLNLFDAHEPHFPPDSVKEAMPPQSRWDDYSHHAGVVVGAWASQRDKWTMDEAERGAHAAGYHSAILRMDSEIRRLMEELDRRGTLENTVFVIASDHGEQLGEHNLFGHSNSLYLPALHVPLMVFDGRKDKSRTVVRDVVSLRDVAATILDLAGLQSRASGIPGRSLVEYWTEPGQGRDELNDPASGTAFSVLYRPSPTEPWYPAERGPAMYSLVDSVYHYILNGDGTEELFDLRQDPGEHSNLVGSSGKGPLLARFRESLVRVAPEVLGRVP